MLRPATRKELDSKPPQYLLDEIERLLQQEVLSHRELQEYIEAMPMNIPDRIQSILDVDAPLRQDRDVEAHRTSPEKEETSS